MNYLLLFLVIAICACLGGTLIVAACKIAKRKTGPNNFRHPTELHNTANHTTSPHGTSIHHTPQHDIP